MVTVVVEANGQDKKFWNAMFNIISRNFGVICCVGKTVNAQCENAQILITDTKSFDLLCCDHAVILCKDAQPLHCKLETKNQPIAVVDACNKALLQHISATGLPAVTCGLSACDTITLSSINEDSAVINVQRSINCFDGSVVEPQEIPIALYSPIDSYTLMAVATIFILTGNIVLLTQIKI